MEQDKSTETGTGPDGAADKDEIFIKIPNPFRLVRSTRRFFNHPVFNHFRNAQMELMKGIRDVVDYEIKQAEKSRAEGAAEYASREGETA